MTYTEKDFSTFTYNPLVKEDVAKLVAQIPLTLNATDKDGFTMPVYSCPIIHGLLSYTMLIYDPRSILIRERDIEKRKILATELAKLQPNEEYFTLENATLMQIVVWYLKSQVKSREFAAIVAVEYKYWENIAELMTPIVGETNTERLEAAKKKAIISGEVDNDINKLNQYYKTFFGDDDAIATQVKKQSFRGENFAHKQ